MTDNAFVESFNEIRDLSASVFTALLALSQPYNFIERQRGDTMSKQHEGRCRAWENVEGKSGHVMRRRKFGNVPVGKGLKNHAFLCLLLLSLLLQIACSDAGSATAPQDAAGATPNVQNLDFDLSAFPVVDRARITISNQGADAALLPAVFVAGGSALNRSSVLALLQSGGTLTDEQFALATWQFVVDHTSHYCYAGAPGDASNFALEPMRLFHGFAFICCDQSSRILNWLWQGAGYQTRVVSMNFHVVPEIFYKNAWHMYDGDHRVYYLETDNKTVANVADVIANPELVARAADANGNDPVGYSAQFMAGLYSTAVPYYTSIDYSTSATYSLQPGQSLTLRSENATTDIFHGGSSDPIGPTAVSSAKFDWFLDYSKSDWNMLPHSEGGVATLASGNDVFLTNSGTAVGSVVYSFSGPFPAFHLDVSGLAYLADSSATINAYFSKDGSHWSGAVPMSSPVGTAVQTTADLSNLAWGQYSYFVKLELSGRTADAAQIAAVHITSEVQTAKVFFPQLVPGVVNHLTYQDWSPTSDNHDVKVSLSVP